MHLTYCVCSKGIARKGITIFHWDNDDESVGDRFGSLINMASEFTLFKINIFCHGYLLTALVQRGRPTRSSCRAISRKSTPSAAAIAEP